MSIDLLCYTANIYYLLSIYNQCYQTVIHVMSVCVCPFMMHFWYFRLSPLPPPCPPNTNHTNSTIFGTSGLSPMHIRARARAVEKIMWVAVLLINTCK